MHYTTDIKGSLLPYHFIHHHHTDGHIQDRIDTLSDVRGCNNSKGFCDKYDTYQTQNIYFQKVANLTHLLLKDVVISM